jgi:DNA invertase Pin-like site-specific DNA recombinase
MPKEWLGYHRISRVGDRVDTPVSEGEAKREIERIAVELAVPVRMLPTEKNESGGKLARPILDGAVTEIEGGRAAGLIVVQYDRLSRLDLADALMVIKRIEDAGGQVISARENFDTTVPEGAMARDVFLSMSRMQLARQKLYVRASKKRAVENGIWPMSRANLGYTVTRRKHGGDGKLKPDPETKGLVVAGFEARARGMSWAEVARIIGCGITQAGRIVSNRVYLGEIRLESGDGEVWLNPAAHEPLITRELWQAAQLDRPRPPRNALRQPALLAGLVRCVKCGGAASPNSWVKDGYVGRSYKCGGNRLANGACTAPAMISQSKLDPYVEGILLPYIEGIHARAAERTGVVNDLIEQLAAAVAERDAYQRATSVSTIGADVFLAGMEERQAEVERLEMLLAEARSVTDQLPAIENLREEYGTWSVEDRRHLLRSSLGVVWLKRGRGPADGRVKLVARGYEPRRGGWTRTETPSFAWDDDLPGEIGVSGNEDLA